MKLSELIKNHISFLKEYEIDICSYCNFRDKGENDNPCIKCSFGAFTNINFIPLQIKKIEAETEE